MFKLIPPTYDKKKLVLFQGQNTRKLQVAYTEQTIKIPLGGVPSPYQDEK